MGITDLVSAFESFAGYSRLHSKLYKTRRLQRVEGSILLSMTKAVVSGRAIGWLDVRNHNVCGVIAPFMLLHLDSFGNVRCFVDYYCSSSCIISHNMRGYIRRLA